MAGGWPADGQIPADLAEQRQHRRFQTGYLGYIDAEQLVGLSSQIKSSFGRSALFALLRRISVPLPIRGQWLLRRIDTGFKRAYQLFDFPIALCDLLLIRLIEQACCRSTNKRSGSQLVTRDFWNVFTLALMRASRNLASSAGSRSPSKMASTIASPVVPVMSLITC